MANDSAPPDKLSVIVFDGRFDRVHYALVLASSAAAVGRSATLFFTMGACHAMRKGNAAWRDLPLSQGDGTGGSRDDELADRNLATFEELLAACVEMGVTFMVCEMGLLAEGLTRADLRDDVDFAEGGVVTFLNDASKDGAIIFI